MMNPLQEDIHPGNPYVIAEIGVNHFDIAENRGLEPIDAAKFMVKEAAESGADAVKFQSYKADQLASKEADAYWDTDEEDHTTQYDLFSEYDSFGASEFTELAEYADSQGVDFLSTPFDTESVEYLSSLVPAFKVASSDLTNTPLLREIAEHGKPIILSTGASYLGEIDEAIRTIDSYSSGKPQVALLHCILDYPTSHEDANLRMIEHLDDSFPECAIGYSDHVQPDSGMITLINAVQKGACIIEKHFTTNKDLEGNDHYHAMGPNDLKTFISNLSIIRETNGRSTKKPIKAEFDSRKQARRSLVAKKDINEGAQLTADNITAKRPGTGISPIEFDKIIGRVARKNISKDEIITWDDV